MQEDFLHYIWKHKKLHHHNLKTIKGEPVVINTVGHHNTNAGPDFFNAQLRIDDQLWAGNVEIHIKSSDWFVHHHETDRAYDNVILHVVWEHDVDVFRKDNTTIATLELKSLIDKRVLEGYDNLFTKQNKWINCEDDFAKTDNFILKNWLERLYFERLERKSRTIETLLENSNNDWEAVLFKLLAKNFGLKVNGESFFSLATSIDFSIIRKTQCNRNTIEALLFGQAGLLETHKEIPYALSLYKEYKYLKQKFSLNNSTVLPVHFFRLRPHNFPTIRLSQLAGLYHNHQNVFSKIIETNTIEDFYKLFEVTTSSFWETHYTFQKASKASIKKMSKSFIDLFIINTIIPIKFCYAKQQGASIETTIIDIANAIASEKNSIVTAFNNLNPVSKTALQSQALIQLKTTYCDKHKCLQCAIGNTIIGNCLN